MELIARDLSVTLSGRTVLSGASVALRAGEVVGLLGPNGAGKSTLLRAIAGHVASEGAVTADGRDLKALPPSARSRLIAYLPQARTISWALSVRNLVNLGRMPWHGFGQGMSKSDTEICNDAMALMDALGIRRALFVLDRVPFRVVSRRVFLPPAPSRRTPRHCLPTNRLPVSTRLISL